MYEFLSLLWWAFLASIIYLIWYKIARPKAKEVKVSFFTLVFAVILTITVISLFTLIWEDLSDLATGEGYLPQLPQPQRASLQLKAIFYHTGFVVPVVVLALGLYFGLCKKGLKYSAMVTPYLIGSIFMVMRLLFDIGSYIVEEYERLGIYIVLAVLVAVFSGVVFFVQQKWEERKKEQIL